MKLSGWLAGLGLVLALAGTAAADTVKIGILGPFSGPFAQAGRNFKAGVEAYVALHGSKAGGNDVEFVYRDLDNADPGKAKALAQELIIKEKVQYLGGVYLTPSALAIAPMLEEAKVPLVIFNAATSVIVQKSPYIVRTSFTLWQTTTPIAKVAAKQGIKKVIVAVTDYGPGLDAEAAFKKTFEAAGGTIVEAVRMPLQTTDFGPIMLRLKDSGAEAVFAFLPAGAPTLAFVKSFNDSGLKAKGIKFIAPGDLTQESDLPALGDAALGIMTTFHYAVSHKSALNEQFVAAATKALGNPDDLTFPAVGAFDGAHLLYKMIEATGGKSDPDKALAAVKGLAWESPRGPVKIDPDTRHIRQNIYLRVVERVDGKFINKEVETFVDQPDFGLMQ